MNGIKILEKLQAQALKKARLLPFDYEYLPGVTEAEDLHKVFNHDLQIYCYGPSKERALAAAEFEASLRLMGPVAARVH